MIARRRERGVTVIELAIVAVILAVFAAIAMPFLNGTIVRQRGRGAVERVATDLRYAQSQAVIRGALYALHSGADAGQPGKYRLERSTDGGGTWIAEGPWVDLSEDYRLTSLASIKDTSGAGTTINRVIFNAQGATSATPATTNFPFGVNVTTPSEGTRTILVMRAGSIRMP